MDESLVHVELLGPRVGLDDWLETVQTAGVCHLVDAMVGQEGVAGIARPLPRPEERRAVELRSDALLSLRALSTTLPAVPSERERGVWSLPPGGVDEEALAARAQHVSALARELREGWETLRRAGEAVERLERARAAAQAGVHAGLTGLAAGALLLVPDATARALTRALRRGAGPVGRAGCRQGVVFAVGDARAAQPYLLAVAGTLTPLDLPEDLWGRPPREALALVEGRLSAAVEHERGVALALTERLGRDGAQARRALDGLEDAEARLHAHRLFASTGHVVQVRAYLPREALPGLAARLTREHGPTVVLRELPLESDAPSPLRSEPATPFEALRALSPSRLGSRPAAGPLALGLCSWAAVVAGDAAVGLLLLLGGAWLGRGARPDSPRREAGLWAQGCGLLAFVAGLLGGRAAGGWGRAALGDDWALLPGCLPADPWSRLEALGAGGAVLGLGLALYALLRLLRRSAERTSVLRRGAAMFVRAAALHGLLAWALVSGGAAPGLAALGYAALLALLLSAGERRALTQDLLGAASAAGAAALHVVATPWLLAGGTSTALASLETGHVGALALIVLGLPLVLSVWLLESLGVAQGFPHEIVVSERAVAPAFRAFASTARREQGPAPAGGRR